MTIALVMAEVLAPVQALAESGVGVPIQRGSPAPSTTVPDPSPGAPATVPPPTFAPVAAPTTTRPTTTTTTRPSTTTTTASTTTTRPPPCTWAGKVQVARTGFVFDGQSNVLSPDWSRSFAKKLMDARFASNPRQVPAVRGSSYEERIGWAADRTDPHVGIAPCVVLVSHGGETDLLQGRKAWQLAQSLQSYVAGRRAAGFDVVVVPTIPPSTAYTVEEDAERVAYNDGLRRGYRSIGVDVIVDVAAIPELQDPSDQRWYGDGAHFTDAASSLVADAYSRALP